MLLCQNISGKPLGYIKRARVLELGCGTGSMWRSFQKHMGCLRVSSLQGGNDETKKCSYCSK